LANSSASAVFYIVIENETATRIDWIPCADASRCLQVTPHSEKTVPNSDIIGYTPGDQQAIVYWWHLVPAPGGGVRADSVRVVQVRLGPGA
jgi:hypothetical protein